MSRFHDAVLVTTNRLKAEEIIRGLGRELPTVGLDIPEIQSLDVAEVARNKAKAAYELLKQPVLVDDSGIEIDALDGFPGALASFVFDHVGQAGLLTLLAGRTDRSARTVTALVYHDEETTLTFRAALPGTIVSGTGTPGAFGYDGFFVPDRRDPSAEEPAAASSRTMAVAMLRAALDDAAAGDDAGGDGSRAPG